jgi:hypothetical protein
MRNAYFVDKVYELNTPKPHQLATGTYEGCSFLTAISVASTSQIFASLKVSLKL